MKTPGALVISLDLEILWGVRDSAQALTTYRKNLLGVRQAVRSLLRSFEVHDIAATWATVGLLFARSGQEAQRFLPAIKPQYLDRSLCPFGEQIGQDEETDPLHLAPSLVNAIKQTPRQELATHTFSHLYCWAEGCSYQAFQEDLRSAQSIAHDFDVKLKSLVFPRNQVRWTEALRDFDIVAYRGNEPWQGDASLATSSGLRRWFLRIVRLLDTYANLTGSNGYAWTELRASERLCNVPASRFLRPYPGVTRTLENRRFERISRSLRDSAEHGKIYHLWWHPHNFGINLSENMSFLERILAVFEDCRRRYGMESLSMTEVATRVLSRNDLFDREAAAE